ncbi:MAG: hypothetical protein DRO88_03905 [Promethearchaeia archaeon]|nr:MAG: hypothetical protein DRO88_03905 [Candidatus Lokiarchaeia archaeon]
MSTPEEILRNLKSEDLAARKRAIFTVGEKKTVESIPILLDLLKSDPDSVIRNSAARALGKINAEQYHDQIFDSLIKALEDSDYYVKANACWSLGKLKDKRAIPSLMKMVDPNQRFYSTVGDGFTQNTISESEASEKIREEGVKFSDVIVGAIKALGEIGDPEGIPALLSALEDKDDGNVRCAACLALGKIKDKEAVPALVELLKKEKYWYVRRDAIKALKKIGDPRAADELINKISDMYDEVRKFAKKALLSLGKQAPTAILKLYMKNPNDEEIKKWMKNNFTRDEILENIKRLEENEEDKEKKEEFRKFFEHLLQPLV